MEERIKTTFQTTINHKLKTTFENSNFTFYTFSAVKNFPFETIKIVRMNPDEIITQEEEEVLQERIEENELSTWKMHISFNIKQLRKEMLGMNAKRFPFETFLCSIRDHFQGEIFYFKISNLEIFEKNRNGIPSVKRGRLYYGAQITIYMDREDTGYDYANFLPHLYQAFKKNKIKPGLLPISDMPFYEHISCRKQFNENGEYVPATEQTYEELNDNINPLQEFVPLVNHAQKNKTRIADERQQALILSQKFCLLYNAKCNAARFEKYKEVMQRMVSDLEELIKLDDLAITEREKLVKRFAKKYSDLPFEVLRQAFKIFSHDYSKESPKEEQEHENETRHKLFYKIFKLRDEIFQARYAYINKQATRKAFIYAAKRSPLALLVIPVVPLIVMTINKNKELKQANDISKLVLPPNDYKNIKEQKLKEKKTTNSTESPATLQLFNSRGNFKIGLWQSNDNQVYYLPYRKAAEIDKKLARSR